MPPLRRAMPAAYLMPVLLAGVGLAALAALLLGGADLTPSRILSALWDGLRGQTTDETAARIVLGIRLPRIVLALAIGSSMGLAGLAAQTLFRNPLASPINSWHHEPDHQEERLPGLGHVDLGGPARRAALARLGNRRSAGQ